MTEPKTPTDRTPVNDDDLAAMFADASKEAWENHRDLNPKVATLLNAVRGGRLTFEQFAEAIFGIAWLAGYSSGWNTVAKLTENVTEQRDELARQLAELRGEQ